MLFRSRVEGTWRITDSIGTDVTVRLTQSFQNVGGEVTAGAKKQTLVGASLRGSDLKFSFNDDKGATRTFAGTVSGGSLKGLLRNGSAQVDATGKSVGEIRTGAWSQMAPGCQKFYGG